MWSVRRRTVLLLLPAMAMAAARTAGAAEVLLPENLGTPGRWTTTEGSPPAATATVDGKPVLVLGAPFSKITGWRYAWDLEFDAARQLGAHRWIRLRARCTDPEALSGLHVYFRTGKGWYRAGMGGVGKAWTNLKIARAGFEAEGEAGSWDAIQQIRIGLTPGARRDTVVEIAGLTADSSYTADDAAKVGPYASVAELKAGVAACAPCLELVKRGEAALAKGAFDDGHARLVEAYVRAQSPKAGEFRGMWCHDGTAYGMGWKRVVSDLKANGFNAIIPNLLWSGIAYYPSTVVPTAPVVATKGDQLKELLDAAHANGIEVHLWKVCWQMGWMADPKTAVPFRFAGRMQVGSDGKPGDWLCPSNEQNRTYELDAIREVVGRYPIDGFHLDYIRYHGDEYCFCKSCKANFEEGVNAKFSDWPKPVVAGGRFEKQYREWRRGVITSFVRDVKRMMRDVRPKAKLSAAVFAEPDGSRESVLQDWTRWVREGHLDFVCPMNYTEDLNQMKGRLRAELDAVNGKIPVYPGLFATYGEGKDQQPDQAVAQIVAAREMGAQGFVLFELEDHVARNLLPTLRLGVTRE